MKYLWASGSTWGLRNRIWSKLSSEWDIPIQYWAGNLFFSAPEKMIFQYLLIYVSDEHDFFFWIISRVFKYFSIPMLRFFDLSIFFRAIQSQRMLQNMTFFIIFGRYWDANKPTPGSIKTQKLPYADVWKCKMCLRHRMGLSFALVDGYDPKQVCKIIDWCIKAFKIF